MNTKTPFLVACIYFITAQLFGQDLKGLEDRISQDDRSSTNKRIALVIGNANYEHAGELKNPINDAELIETTLKKIGSNCSRDKET